MVSTTDGGTLHSFSFPDLLIPQTRTLQFAAFLFYKFFKGRGEKDVNPVFGF